METKTQKTMSPLVPSPTLRRDQAAPSHGEAGADAPSIVHDVLRQPGAALDEHTRDGMRAHFGRDFSHVRVHTGESAAASARAVDAVAYTVGRDVVFGRGMFDPSRPTGRALLRHELTHVSPSAPSVAPSRIALGATDAAEERVAESNERAGRPAIHALAGAEDAAVFRRKGGSIGGFFANIGREIADLVTGSEPGYDATALETYLVTLRKTHEIEDDFDSDNKARGVVRQRLYVSENVDIRALLVREMLAGYCSGDDERAILEILFAATGGDRARIVEAVGQKTLVEKFGGAELGKLKELLNAPERPMSIEDELAKLVVEGDWEKTLRPEIYWKASAVADARSMERHEGKRPEMTGLGRLKTLDRFAGVMKTIQAKWAKLTKRQRTDELKTAANVELEDAQVPGFRAVVGRDFSAKAFFNAREWNCEIANATLESASLDDENAGDLANSAIHESRHAEEAFLAARYAAGILNYSAAKIVKEFGIPQSPVAERAVRAKFGPSTGATELELGRTVYETAFVHPEEHAAAEHDPSIDILKRIWSEAVAALKNLRQSPSPAAIHDAATKRDALRAQILRVREYYAKYRADPIEADAHEVGDAEELAFRGWKPRQ